MNANAVPSGPPPAGGGPPYDQSLERRVTVLETRFDTILPTLLTKAEFYSAMAEIRLEMEKLRTDVHKAIGEVHKSVQSALKWAIGLTITLVLSMLGLFLSMNNLYRSVAAYPPAASAPAPAPAPAPSAAVPAPPR